MGKNQKEPVLKKSPVLLTLICGISTAFGAQKAWISDELRTAVYDKPASDAKFLGTLRSGEAVEMLDRNGDYIHVKTGELNGWVSARSIMETPSVHSRFAEQQQQLQQLQGEAQNLQNTTNDQNQSLDALKARLEENLNQKQLYIGGFLVFAGFILHWLSGLFRLGQRRRSSFDDL